MKKLILIFSVLLFQLNYSFANDKVIESLKEGGKLIFIRHALAPGNGDPANFELQNCSTQRNLNEIGIQQSKKIGLIFKKMRLKLIIFILVSGADVKILQNMLLMTLRHLML